MFCLGMADDVWSSKDVPSLPEPLEAWDSHRQKAAHVPGGTLSLQGWSLPLTLGVGANIIGYKVGIILISPPKF